MEKKTLLAVVLSILVIIGYQVYAAKNYPALVENKTAATTVVNEAFAERSAGKSITQTLPEPEISNAPETVIIKETDRYIVTFSSVGGAITNIKLKNGVCSAIDRGCDLVYVKSAENKIFNISGLGSNRTPSTNFSIEGKGEELIFTAKISGGIELIKKYIIRNTCYNIDLEMYIRNISDGQITTSYIINTAADVGIDSKIDIGYIQAVVEIDDKMKKSGGSKDPIKGNVGYVGVHNRYFSVIAKNYVPSGEVIIKKLSDGNMSTAVRVSEFAVLPRSVVCHKFLLYAGPTDKKIMGEYGLASAADQGLLGGISGFLLASLKLFHKIFRNWGIAVILLSVMVNLALFPLSRKSYESMKKMQSIQPHMDNLRVEHKDNPQKLNKEMMELYKKYDVNPMGGCLPLLLQMPVFIALYQALMKSLELRGSGFLWVRDLSMPDAVPLSFSLPLIGNTINVLPILMTIAMVFQQRFSTIKGAAQSEQQKQQQQMMVIMPVVFLFIMYSFPSGLVLYWLVNTILTTFEQRAIMHA